MTQKGLFIAGRNHQAFGDRTHSVTDTSSDGLHSIEERFNDQRSLVHLI